MKGNAEMTLLQKRLHGETVFDDSDEIKLVEAFGEGRGFKPFQRGGNSSKIHQNTSLSIALNNESFLGKDSR